MAIPFDQIKKILDEMIDERIATLTLLRDEAQREANCHKGAMVSRHDTFKEEAQYNVDKHNGNINSLRQEKALLAEISARPVNNNMFSVITVTSDVSDVELFLSPVLGGEKIRIDGKEYSIATPRSPIGAKIIDAAVDYEFNLNNLTYNIVKITDIN